MIIHIKCSIHRFTIILVKSSGVKIEKPVVVDDKKAARKRTATARKTASSKKATDANDMD